MEEAYPFVKLVRDGKVAVLVSPRYGAGWFTWNTEHPGLALDGDLAQAVLDSDIAKCVHLAKERYGDFYEGGSDSLRVEWVTQGQAFEITEYDGYESLRIIDISDFMVA